MNPTPKLQESPGILLPDSSAGEHQPPNLTLDPIHWGKKGDSGFA